MKRDLSNLTHWLKKFLNIIRFFYPISQEDCEKEVLEKVPENWNFDRKNRNFDRKNRKISHTFNKPTVSNDCWFFYGGKHPISYVLNKVKKILMLCGMPKKMTNQPFCDCVRCRNYFGIIFDNE